MDSKNQALPSLYCSSSVAVTKYKTTLPQAPSFFSPPPKAILNCLLKAVFEWGFQIWSRAFSLAPCERTAQNKWSIAVSMPVVINFSIP